MSDDENYQVILYIMYFYVRPDYKRTLHIFSSRIYHAGVDYWLALR